MPNPAIARHRLHNQHLTTAKFDTPADVVTRLAAVQAQEYPLSAWALGLRMDGAVQNDVDRALADGTILRTHVLRPTWHYVTPADIRWMLELTAPRINALNAPYYRQYELDETLFSRANDIIAGALQGGNQLTKAEIADLLKQGGILGDHYRISYILFRAELDALICSGARRGSKATYALLAERAPDARRLPRDEALAELTERYFATRSPATAQDFAWWSGLTMADARAGIDQVKSRLNCEVIEGVEYWLSDSSVPADTTAPVIHLLPVYDEYIVAYTDRSAVYAESPEFILSDNIVFYHVITLDGMVVGTWKRAIKKNAVMVEPTFFTPLTDAEQEAFTAAVQRYGDFLGLSVSVI